MMKSLALVLCLVLVAAALPGCASKGLSVSEARSLCLTYSADGGPGSESGSSCLEQNEICEEMIPQDLLATMDEAQCMAHCDEVKWTQRKLHPADGCQLYVDRAWSLCRSACRAGR